MVIARVASLPYSFEFILLANDLPTHLEEHVTKSPFLLSTSVKMGFHITYLMDGASRNAALKNEQWKY